MSNYRPITDMWILARAKLKPNPDGSRNTYYGAYLGGFVERARALLGCKLSEPVLHVCGGKAKCYPYKRGFGPNDKTLDLDPSVNPDFLRDAREPFPMDTEPGSSGWEDRPWAGILIDPPYTEDDAAYYAPGKDKFPKPNLLVRNALEVLPPGGRVGIICYHWPSPPKGTICVAAVGVLCGYNNRIRVFSTFERPASTPPV
jgi:hypothetical protein